MLDDLTTPLDLQDATLGPVEVSVTRDRIAFYVDVTGDDLERWADEAPPGFASVLLFAVADLFLYHPKVVPFTATLLHLDQSFTYVAPIHPGSTLTVEGSITRVRERRGSYFVTFEAVGTDGDREVLRSVSTFVLSDQQAPRSEAKAEEPPARTRAENEGAKRSASRHDLIRYAAATRDFNPLHWDHTVAIEAGLSGTVVHGLLMYAWMAQAAATAGGMRVTEAKVRFRSALHPGEQAMLVAEPQDGAVKLELRRGDTPLVTGTASVAPSTE